MEPSDQPPQVPAGISIEAFSLARDLTAVADIWAAALPTYPLPAAALGALLDRPHGAHFVARAAADDGGRVVGFCATYAPAHVAAVVVAPGAQRRGIGGALLEHGRRRFALAAQPPAAVAAGSSSPRFWPGVPTDLPAGVHAFFERQGYTKHAQTSADFYRDITAFEPPARLLARAHARGVTFAPWTAAGYGACMKAQLRNFGTNAAWIAAYQSLHALGRHEQVMVASTADGTQVGWTLMVAPGPENLIAEHYAFPAWVGENVGLVACVGVESEWRGGGVGLALVASAMEDMRRRGVEGVFVDWVVLEGWYEKLGFQKWREYREGSK